jgi:hypothetical protein
VTGSAHHQQVPRHWPTDHTNHTQAAASATHRQQQGGQATGIIHAIVTTTTLLLLTCPSITPLTTAAHRQLASRLPQLVVPATGALLEAPAAPESLHVAAPSMSSASSSSLRPVSSLALVALPAGLAVKAQELSSSRGREASASSSDWR